MGSAFQSTMARILLALVLLGGAPRVCADTQPTAQVTPLATGEDRLPVLQVTLHSRSKPDQARTFRFLLDTGAFRCVLDTSVPEAFFWTDPVPMVPLNQGNGPSAEAPSIFIKRLSVGGMLRDMVPAARMDLKNSLLGRCQDQPMDGILGMSFLRDTRFVYDPLEHRLEWWKVLPTGVTLPIEYLPDGRPAVQVHVRKEAVVCALDTGAALGILLPAALKPAGHGRTFNTGGTVASSIGTGTEFHLERVEAAGHVWPNVDVDFQDGFTTGLLGQDVWSAAPACFDFTRNLLTLTPNPGGSLPILPATHGLPILWDRTTTPAKLVVLLVRPDSVLEKAGLKPGDQVLQADGVEGDALKRRTLIESLAHEAPRTWLIRRGDHDLKAVF